MRPEYVSDLNDKERKVHEDCLKQINYSYQMDDDNIKDYRKSVTFNLVSQWTAAEKAEFSRNYKVAFEFNQLYPYIRNIIGAQLQNTPDILIRPKSVNTDDKKAELMEGMVRYVGYASKLDEVLQNAAKCSLIGGFGALYLMTDYESENTFKQCLRIKQINDPTDAYFDPDAKELNKEDGEYAGYVEGMTQEEFKQSYPDIKYPISISNNTDIRRAAYMQNDKELVVIANHWVREYYFKSIVQLSDGTELDADDVDEYLNHYRDRMVAMKLSKLIASEQSSAAPMQNMQQPPMPPQQDQQQAMMPAAPQMNPSMQDQMPPQQAQMPAQGMSDDEDMFSEDLEEPTEVKRRRVRCCRIMYYKMIENARLEKTEWPSKYLAVLYVPGDDFYIEGKRRTKSCTRYAMDAQRFYNYTMSTLAEVMKTTRKEQWLVSKANVQSPDIQEVWRRPDQQQGALIYESDPDTGAKPEKMPVGELPQSWIATAGELRNDMQNIVGRHEASMGQPGNEISGIAIKNRIVQSSLGAYTYLDNINKTVVHLGKVEVDMLPRLNDTETTVPILTRDNMHKLVTVNKLKDTYSDEPEYDNELSSECEFDVEVSVGDTNELQKQEYLNQLIKVCELPPNPKLDVILDKVADNLNLPNAKEIRDRWATLMPPAIRAEVMGQPPPPPAGPDPRQQMMQMEMKIKEGELQNKMVNNQIDKEKLQLQYQQMQMEAQNKQREAQIQIAKIEQEAKLAGVQLHNQALRSATELASTHAKALTDHMTHSHNVDKFFMNTVNDLKGNAHPT